MKGNIGEKMFCEKCGQELVNGDVCQGCGYDNKAGKYVKATSSKGLKKKIGIMIVLILLSAGVGTFAYMFFYGPLKVSRDSGKLVQLIEKRDFNKAYDFYKKDIKDKDNTKSIATSFLKDMSSKYNEILKEYNNGKIDDSQLEKLESLLQEVKKLNVKDEKCNNFITEYQNLKSSKKNYTNGNTFLENKEYQSAIDSFLGVISQDKNYDDAQKKVKESIEKLVEENDYSNAFDIINYYSANFTEEELSTLKKNVESAVLDAADKKTKEYFEKGKYEDAKSYLEDLQYTYPDITGISDKLDSLEQDYVALVIEDAKKYFDEKDYGKAASIVSVAIKQIGDDNVELNNLYNEYRSYVDTYLDEMEVFNATGSVYTGDSKDNTGKEHSHSFYLNEDDAKYLLEGKYNTLSGIAAISFEGRNTTDEFWYEIYGDENLLYTTKHHTGGSFPEEFSVDITNVNILQIKECGEYNYGEFEFFDTILKRNKE